VNAAAMQQLTARVLTRFAAELDEAVTAGDVRQFDHLAARPEGRYTSRLGTDMRALVDAARPRLTVPAGGAR
jgi:hypothetical protein